MRIFWCVKYDSREDKAKRESLPAGDGAASTLLRRVVNMRMVGSCIFAVNMRSEVLGGIVVLLF